MQTHVMVDIETLGTEHDAVILSIGAVRFAPFEPGLPWEQFYVCITPVGQAFYKRVIDAKTLMWWTDPARREVWSEWYASEKTDLATALEGLATWLQEPRLDDVQPPPMWGNGATFDNVILRSAYQACNMECPWSYKDDRCFRTLKNSAPQAMLPDTTRLHHNALGDAIYQTAWLMSIVRHNNLTAI